MSSSEPIPAGIGSFVHVDPPSVVARMALPLLPAAKRKQSFVEVQAMPLDELNPLGRLSGCQEVRLPLASSVAPELKAKQVVGAVHVIRWNPP